MSKIHLGYYHTMLGKLTGDFKKIQGLFILYQTDYLHVFHVFKPPNFPYMKGTKSNWYRSSHRMRESVLVK